MELKEKLTRRRVLNQMEKVDIRTYLPEQHQAYPELLQELISDPKLAAQLARLDLKHRALYRFIYDLHCDSYEACLRSASWAEDHEEHPLYGLALNADTPDDVRLDMLERFGGTHPEKFVYRIAAHGGRPALIYEKCWSASPDLRTASALTLTLARWRGEIPTNLMNLVATEVFEVCIGDAAASLNMMRIESFPRPQVVAIWLRWAKQNEPILREGIKRIFSSFPGFAGMSTKARELAILAMIDRELPPAEN